MQGNEEDLLSFLKNTVHRALQPQEKVTVEMNSSAVKRDNNPEEEAVIPRRPQQLVMAAAHLQRTRLARTHKVGSILKIPYSPSSPSDYKARLTLRINHFYS